MVRTALWPRPPKLLQAPPAQGAPQSILLRGCRSPSLRRAEKRLPRLQAAAQVPPPPPFPSSPSLLSCLPLLRAAAALAVRAATCACARPLSSLPLAPPILVIHLPASQARQGAVLAPWGRDCVEKEEEATAWGRVAFSVLWREGLGLASCSRIYSWGGGRVRGSELRTHTHTPTHTPTHAHLCRFGLSASRMT